MVFGEGCGLKKVSECSCPVIKAGDVCATAKRFAGERGDVLTDAQQRDVVAKLEPLAYASDAAKTEHVEQVEAKKGAGRGGREA